MRDGTLTKQRLEQCALMLFVKKGITATTIKDIATEAGIAEGTLYRHYQSKDQLAEQLFIRSYEVIYDKIKQLQSEHQSISDKIRAMIDFFCESYDNDPILFNYLLLSQHHQLKNIVQREISMHQLFVTMFSTAIHKQELKEADPHVYSATMLGIVLQAAISRVYHRITRSMKDDQTILFHAVMGALKA